MHEWYLEHVKIPVHVILPVCFEKLWKDFEWNEHHKILTKKKYLERRMQTLRSLG